MKRLLPLALSVLLAAPLPATPPVEPTPYTAATALREAFDPATLERENDPPRRTLFFSSTGPMGRKRGFFARAEGDERVLLDVEGPGVVTWIRFGERRGKLRFRFDGAKDPQWEIDVETLLNPYISPVPNWLVDMPLYGGEMRMPITFARGLMISVVDAPMSEYNGSVSIFAPNTNVETWWPMAPDSPKGLGDALEFSRRVRRSDAPPWREDAVLAEISTNAPWRAAKATLITAIEVDPFVEGDRIVVRLPAKNGAEEFDIAPFLTPVRPERTRVTPTPAPPAPGIRRNPLGAQGPASEWTSSPARAIFHIPFRVEVGEEIAVLDAVTVHAGKIRIRGRVLAEHERTAAPRLAVSRFDQVVSGTGDLDELFTPPAPVVFAHIEGVGRMLAVWGKYTTEFHNKITDAILIIDASDAAGGPASYFAGQSTMPQGPLFAIQPTQPDPRSDAAIPPRIDKLNSGAGVASFLPGGIDFAGEITAQIGSDNLTFIPPTRLEVIALGQVFDGPAPSRASLSEVAREPAGRIRIDSVGGTGLPILAQSERAETPYVSSETMKQVDEFRSASWMVRSTPRQDSAMGERVLEWQAGEGDGEELREEEDGSVVLDVDPDFVAMPGDRLEIVGTISPRVPAYLVRIDAQFEPHSGNEAFPYFSKRVLAKRGDNGIEFAHLHQDDDATTTTVMLGNNASWTGSRHDRITLKLSAPAPHRLHVTTATLRRMPAKPRLDAATARVPLLAREGKRELDLYPGAEVHLSGDELVKAFRIEGGFTWNSVYRDVWPQARLEEIEAWPLGFRYKLPADGYPSLDNVPVAVFDAEGPNNAIRLTHPGLKGAKRLAVRFGTGPEGARVVVLGSDGRFLACEDTFMTESVVPAQFTLIELGAPNPDDHILFIPHDQAPGSSGHQIVIESVDILETDATVGSFPTRR